MLLPWDPVAVIVTVTVLLVRTYAENCAAIPVVASLTTISVIDGTTVDGTESVSVTVLVPVNVLFT